jgi:hypothetical protein
MSATATEKRPTHAQVRAAQMMVERAERGVGPEPGEAIRRLAKATPRD